MALDILNPIEIINELFGNLYFFAGIVSIIYLYIASKYRFNIQLIVFGLISLFLMAMIFEEGFQIWISFIVLIISFFIAYIFWRWFQTR